MDMDALCDEYLAPGWSSCSPKAAAGAPSETDLEVAVDRMVLVPMPVDALNDGFNRSSDAGNLILQEGGPGLPGLGIHHGGSPHSYRHAEEDAPVPGVLILDVFRCIWSHSGPRELLIMAQLLRWRILVMPYLLWALDVCDSAMIDTSTNLRFSGNGHIALMFWRNWLPLQRVNSVCLEFSSRAEDPDEDQELRKKLRRSACFLTSLPEGVVPHLIIDIQCNLDCSYKTQRRIRSLFQGIPSGHIDTLSVFGNCWIPEAILRRFALKRVRNGEVFHGLNVESLHVCSPIFFLPEMGPWGTFQLGELPITRVLSLLNLHLDVGQMDVLLLGLHAPNLQVLIVENVWLQSLMELTHRCPMIQILMLYDDDGDQYLDSSFLPALSKLRIVCGDISTVAKILGAMSWEAGAFNIEAIEVGPEKLMKDPTSTWRPYFFAVQDMVTILEELVTRGVTSLASLGLALPATAKFDGDFYGADHIHGGGRYEASLDINELRIGIICDGVPSIDELTPACSCSLILMDSLQWVKSFRTVRAIAVSVKTDNPFHRHLEDDHSYLLFRHALECFSPFTTVAVEEEDFNSPFFPFEKPNFTSRNVVGVFNNLN